MNMGKTTGVTENYKPSHQMKAITEVSLVEIVHTVLLHHPDAVNAVFQWRPLCLVCYIFLFIYLSTQRFVSVYSMKIMPSKQKHWLGMKSGVPPS